MKASRALKILLVGHACSPIQGSEPGVTWNWAWHLSAHHQVWVLAHPLFRGEVESFLAEHPNSNLNFVWVTLPPRLDPWNPEQGQRGIRLHYILWQRAALRVAIQLHSTHHFDLSHYVSWNTISSPPQFWRLPIPFVWGPVGGGQIAPPSFLRYFGRYWPGEVFRTLRVKILPYMPALRQAVRRSALLFATNKDTAKVLEAAGAKQVRLLYDTGISQKFLVPNPVKRNVNGELTLLWVGRLIPYKALPLALEVITRIGSKLPVRLLIAGEGPLRMEYENLVNTRGLSNRVKFLGSMPWSDMLQVYRLADAFLFTSLRDSSGNVLLEAMAQGLPIITLDHHGSGFLVPPEAGIKVPVTNPTDTVCALAQGVCHLAQSSETRRQMGEAARACVETMIWENRAEQMSRWYEEVVTGHRGHE